MTSSRALIILQATRFGHLLLKTGIIERMAASAKQIALLVFTMTFHTWHIPAIVHVVVGILPFFIFGSCRCLNKFVPVVTIKTDKISWKGCRL